MRRDRDANENTMSWIDFTGKVAVITVARAGIGRGITAGFAEAGATVVLLDRDDSAAQALDDITARGGHGIFIRCDVTSDDSVRDAAAQSLATLGPASVLVNN